MHWDQADKPLTEFTSALMKLRRDHPTFRRKQFFTGKAVRSGERLNDIVWLHPDGRPMENGDWENGRKTLGMYLNGQGIAGRDARGNRILDDHFLLFFNSDEALELTLPPTEYSESWDVIIDTGGVADDARTYAAGDRFELKSHSTVVLREHREPEQEPDHSVAASLAGYSGEAQ
jgi:glycogen operon protein